MERHNQGFTLVELLVVIVIIGVLAGVTITILNPSFFFGRGRDSRRQSDLETVRAALEQYYLDSGRMYPDTDYPGLETFLVQYLDAFPTDPGNNAYSYTYDPVNKKCYELSVTLEETGTAYEVCGGSLSCQNSNSFCQ